MIVTPIHFALQIQKFLTELNPFIIRLLFTEFLRYFLIDEKEHFKELFVARVIPAMLKLFLCLLVH